MHMYIIGGVACAMPMGFLVFCTWIVLVEIPKGIAQATEKSTKHRYGATLHDHCRRS